MVVNVAMTFGQWLRLKREEKGLTQMDIARRAGVSMSYISTIERGERHRITGAPSAPSRDIVINIAKALGVDEAEALTRAGYTPEDPKAIDIMQRDDIRIALFTGSIPPEELDEFRRAIEIAVRVAEEKIREKKQKDEQDKRNQSINDDFGGSNHNR